MKNTYKKGFTLVEALVTVVIIGVIALLISSLIDVMPDEDIALAKKSLNTVQRVVQELTNDASIYIDGTFVGGANCGGTNCDNDNRYFCQQFAEQLSVASVNCLNTDNSNNDYKFDDLGTFDNFCENFNNDNNPNIVTTDGIKWYSLNGVFTNDSEQFKVICVKVTNRAAAYGIGINKDGRVVPGVTLQLAMDKEPTQNNAVDELTNTNHDGNNSSKLPVCKGNGNNKPAFCNQKIREH